LTKEKVTEYIKKCRSLGMSDKQIREKLINNGWGSEQIESMGLDLNKTTDLSGNISNIENKPQDNALSKRSREKQTVSYVCEATDNIIPHRNVVWYVFFTITFMIASTLVIFFADWPLLFVVIVAAGVILWRGHEGTKMKIEVTNEGILVNNKKFLFDNMNSFYISRIGEDMTINIILMKKYLPKLTYIFFQKEDAEKVKTIMEKKVPTMEQRKESYVDLIIRKLKI